MEGSQTFSFSFFPCSADHERDWPPCKVVFFGLATNALNVRNNNNNFPPGQGTFRKIGVQFWRKVDMAGYTPPFFGHGGARVGVEQSAVSVTRCK